MVVGFVQQIAECEQTVLVGQHIGGIAEQGGNGGYTTLLHNTDTDVRGGVGCEQLERTSDGLGDSGDGGVFDSDVAKCSDAWDGGRK